ncbi:hypothetical protein THIOM_004752 [Candidatus Thiomargarita nelsonii]|uniref:Uncharacterized protein n=1 Tax=Candidatus Thiomargarita nelsonii TaxID=1003181 RepID=A0A0A6P211_9GAMM|nr:hypothetical protein THIOM_004752 [Candidatus Thiomargarita nelsonii]
MDNFLQRIKQEYKKYTEHMDDTDFMRRNSEFLFFPENTRTAFFQALEAQNTQKAQDLYRKAVEITLIRCERTIGLSISENVELIQAFRERNAEEVIRLMDIAHERRPFQNAKNDTYSRYRKEKYENTNSYKEKDRYYNSRDKQLLKNPITGKEEEMTRTELHDAIIQIQFAWYTQIVNEARSQHYEPKVAFVYDGGEAWYRNSVLRDRALPADGYINFMRAYDTFFHLAQKHGIHAIKK